MHVLLYAILHKCKYDTFCPENFMKIGRETTEKNARTTEKDNNNEK